MRNLIIPESFVSVLILTAAAFVDPALAASPPTVGTLEAPGSTKIDCERFGSEVSALIDAEITSPNISAARAAFELGVADCMFGRGDHATIHYQQVQKLLNPDRPKTAVSSPTRTQRDEQVATAESPASPASLGITLRQLTDGERNQIGVEATIKGVLVEQVDPDSWAWQSGVRAGDVIIRLGVDEVNTPLQATEAIRTAQLENKDQIPLVVMREGRLHYLGVQ